MLQTDFAREKLNPVRGPWMGRLSLVSCLGWLLFVDWVVGDAGWMSGVGSGLVSFGLDCEVRTHATH